VECQRHGALLDLAFAEVTDTGRIDDPLVGRIPPPETGEGGRGL
jgi:hypothetical protein